MVSADDRSHGGKPFSAAIAVALQEKLADLFGKLIPEHRLADPAHLVHGPGRPFHRTHVKNNDKGMNQ